MALTAKFFITVSFNAIYVFSAELFPTVVRYRDTYDLLFKPEKGTIDRTDGNVTHYFLALTVGLACTAAVEQALCIPPFSYN